MIDRVRERHGVHPRIIAADTGYGSGHLLDRLERQGIEAHVPLHRLERQGIEAHVPLAHSRDGTGKRPPKAAFA